METPTPEPAAADLPAESFILTSNGNDVSVVAILCGTGTCEPEPWNNFRLADRPTFTSDSESTDLGPLYRPTSPSEDDFDDGVSSRPAYVLPVAIAIPLAVVVAFAVLFTIYRHNKKVRQKRLDDDRGPYGQLDSGQSSPAISAPTIERLNSSSGTTDPSNRASVFSARTLQTPPPVGPRPPELSRANVSSTYSTYSSAAASVNVPVANLLSPTEPTRPPSIRPPAHDHVQQLQQLQQQRVRANTFSDVPSDELPPYIDPIQEAMADSDHSPDTPHSSEPHAGMLSPPPYDTITLPERAETQH
ncbi:hypothetical protein GGF46_002275 [Coemansia sp. RSA 552]|nr:hypothetical protein GGF46_002275 [Coemansia sp. RSA 552]